MRAFYKQGFIVFKSGRPGPVFIAPHSTMTLLSIERGDVFSELITARLVRLMGGVGVVSTIPRKGRYGVDYFREPASMSEAVKMFNSSDIETRYSFERRFAFFARDEEEYLEKANVYNTFWTTVETLAPKNPFFALIHTQATRLKNFPSLLDTATLSGEWMEEGKVRHAVEEVNKRYKKEFNNIKQDLLNYALTWANMRLRNGINYRFGSFSVNKLKGSFKITFMNDMKKASELLNDDHFDRKDIKWGEYVELIKRCIDSSDFSVTYQNAFDGSRGRERIGKLLRHCGGEALLFETSSFLNEIYPKLSVSIIKDVINTIIRKERLRKFERFFQ